MDVERAGRLATCIAATAPGLEETLRVVGPSGVEVPVEDLRTGGGRVLVVDAPTGEVELSYMATVHRDPGAARRMTREEELAYLRPSRYCPSDLLGGIAVGEIGVAGPQQTAFAVEQWLNANLSYVPGSTDSADDALHPLLSRAGVCRDFAHLGVSLCRALGVPARYTAVYAPGLDPMDFHAVYEAAIDGAWYVFDGTRMAPRPSLLRIASGRDAADTALLTSLGALVRSTSHSLIVTTADDLPDDDRNALETLA